jgi:threonine dehydrogenase-like Zn-dependent dehydrogenase
MIGTRADARGGATTINFSEESVIERLNDLTHGKGPEKCIDAVGQRLASPHNRKKIPTISEPSNLVADAA